jgi:hypothetical protein
MYVLSRPEFSVFQYRYRTLDSFLFPDKSYIRKEALKEAERLFEEEQAKQQVEDLLKNTPQAALETVKI